MGEYKTVDTTGRFLRMTTETEAFNLLASECAELHDGVLMITGGAANESDRLPIPNGYCHREHFPSGLWCYALAEIPSEVQWLFYPFSVMPWHVLFALLYAERVKARERIDARLRQSECFPLGHSKRYVRPQHLALSMPYAA